MLSIEYISTNNKGELYKCYEISDQLKKNIKITLNNVSTIFGIEKVYHNRYVKWTNIDSKIISRILDIEKYIQSNFPLKEIKSVIIEKKNYPIMLNTKINYSKNKNIIESEKGLVPTIEEFIEKKKDYILEINLENIFVAEKYIYYTLLINKIKIA